MLKTAVLRAGRTSVERGRAGILHVSMKLEIMSERRLEDGRDACERSRISFGTKISDAHNAVRISSSGNSHVLTLALTLALTLTLAFAVIVD
jgi:hypothetical protein